MNDQVVMSPANSQLCVAIPLFRIQHSENLGKLEGYNLVLTNEKPLAYILNADDLFTSIVAAEWAEEKLIFLGEL